MYHLALRSFLCWLIFAQIGLNTHAQTKVLEKTIEKPVEKNLEYEIFVNNAKIGILKAKRTGDALNFKIDIHTEVNVSFIYKYRVFVWTYSYFTNGLLTEAYNKKTANKRVKEESKLTYVSPIYQFKNQDTQFNIEQKIYNCTSRLYFEEPKNVKSVLSISLGKMANIKKVADKIYQVDFPDGLSNLYEYNAEGICKSVKPENKWITLEFRLLRSL